jgi:hypothetical protein
VGHPRGPDVARIATIETVDTGSGHLRRPMAFDRQDRRGLLWIAIWLLSISLLVSACASPTAPERSLQNLSGVWQGQWQMTRCDMSRSCAMIVGRTLPYTMRLLESGTHVDGVVNVFGTVNVSGTMLPDGSVTFTGSKPAASDFDPTGDGRITEFTNSPGCTARVRRVVCIRKRSHCRAEPRHKSMDRSRQHPERRSHLVNRERQHIVRWTLGR